MPLALPGWIAIGRAEAGELGQEVIVRLEAVGVDLSVARPGDLPSRGLGTHRASPSRAGQTVLVNGAGGVTGGLLVQLAAHHGATVIATAGGDSAGRVTAMGAATVLDYHQPDWPEQVRSLTDGGVDAAANAVPSGAAETLRTVRNGGRLATITSDPPAAERDITALAVLVVPDGRRLSDLIQLLAQGTLTVSVGEQFSLEQGTAALAQVRHGSHGAVVVLRPRPDSRVDQRTHSRSA